jgi:hypothetical protein
MVVSKTNPTGIDFYIQKLQTQLSTSLVTKWGITDSQYKAYGRCYRNKKDNGYVAEIYTGGNEYKDAYWDDSLSAISFFGITGSEKNAGQMVADVHLVYMVNIKKLKPSITHRGDEEVRADVLDVFHLSTEGFRFESLELWIDNVLREYPGSIRENGLKAVDMHPIHCFRLNLKLIYNSSKIC